MKDQAMDGELLHRSEAYVDELVGPGCGARHAAFLERLPHPALREAMHRAHVLQADVTHLSFEENYLVGMAVLLAQRAWGPAAMFAKTLRHRGVPREKILEVVARLSLWIGPLPAAEAASHVARALREYDAEGPASMAAWFPPERRDDE